MPGMITELVGYAAGALLMISFLPQVLTTWRTRHAKDVSLWMLAITFGSACFYEIYAWRLGLWPVIVMNGIFGVLVATEICLKLRFDALARKVPVSRSI